MKKRLCFCLVASLLLAACSGGSSPTTEPAPDATAPEISLTDKGYLTLSPKDLGQDFLLQASFIEQRTPMVLGSLEGSPTSSGLQSRVVYFQKKNGALFMMESSKGYTASAEIPTDQILTDFPIIEETADKIVFDFNEGMKRTFIASDWYASDYGEASMLVGLKTPHAYLKELKQEKDRTLIRQVAQLEANYLSIPVEVIYYLQRYHPDPTFVPTPSPDFDRVGFFETRPHVREDFGNSEYFITRWNLNKPIVYSISANTPEEFRETIKQGVLYWNKAFGSKIVDVQMAPEGVSAPNPDYNIIQWITNHNADFAYADAQMDPLTGEIEHAQIFIPSSFPMYGMTRLEFNQKVEEEKKKPDAFQIGLKGSAEGITCRYPLFGSEAVALDLQTTAKERTHQIIQDYLRQTIAHEVGHTLGLRHNFSASTSSEMTPNEILATFDHYLKTGEVEVTKTVTSSVMDYLPFPERVLGGHYLVTDEKALPYDTMAIQWAYFSQPTNAPLEETLFCTDSDVYRYSDCQRGDRASHLLLAAASDFTTAAQDLPKQLATNFLRAKAHFDPKERKPVGEVDLDTGNYTWQIANPLRDLMKILKHEDRLLLIRRKIGPQSDVTDKEYDQATTQWINEGVKQGGGIKQLLALIDSKGLYPLLLRYEKQFGEIVAREDFQKGTTLLGENYAFTEQELAVIKKRAKEFFKLLTAGVMREVTDVFANSRRRGGCYDWGCQDVAVPSGSVGKISSSGLKPFSDLNGLEETLGNWAEFIITDNAEKEPTFEGDLRLTATDILLPEQGPTETWQKENRERVLKILMDKLAERYGKPVDQLSADELDPTEAQIIAALMMVKEYPPREAPSK